MLPEGLAEKFPKVGENQNWQPKKFPVLKLTSKGVQSRVFHCKHNELVIYNYLINHICKNKLKEKSWFWVRSKKNVLAMIFFPPKLSKRFDFEQNPW